MNTPPALPPPVDPKLKRVLDESGALQAALEHAYTQNAELLKSVARLPAKAPGCRSRRRK